MSAAQLFQRCDINVFILTTKDLNPVCLSTCIHRPVKDMIEEIRSGNGLGFASGKLRELCKLLPDEGEVLVTAAYIFLTCLLCSINL